MSPLAYTASFVATALLGDVISIAVGTSTCDSSKNAVEQVQDDEVGLLALHAASKDKNNLTHAALKDKYMAACPHACLLPCDSGSCTNWLIQVGSLTECNTYSQQMGCGDCKSSLPAEIAPYAHQYDADYTTLCPSRVSCGQPCSIGFEVCFSVGVNCYDDSNCCQGQSGRRVTCELISHVSRVCV
mmetsp:Transcript_119528/g.266992  ORF Transcript_119528/g.266992 Transcript_119528/m.266992 type:complete len:186 (-) Transcript_119528:177-734(-)